MKSFLIALTASAMLAPAAMAQPEGSRQATVRYGDLDLSNPQGQATLNGRIGRAVTSVCGANDNRNLKQMVDAKRCTTRARTQAEVGVALAKARARDASSGTQLAGH